MLEYNEITERKYIIYEGQPYEVLTSHVFRKQQRKPVNAVKMRNLITGSIKEVSFHVSEKVEEAEIESKEVKYLYTNKGENWFAEANDPSKRFKLEDSLLGPGMKFLKANSVVEALLFDEKIIGIKIPIKVELKVTEAHPAVKGDTAKGGNKIVTLETGATITVPMFIKEGDILRINTETGEYTDRLS
ncbi:MAG TPA: elongation factor P [Candidatus Nanoarchaeia archaeon]|nr:elongation factor P [Candidatus Nanoarchaeia archaeon]